MVGYGRHSETERKSVNYEGLAIWSLLEIQSDPLGNLGDTTTKPYNADEIFMSTSATESIKSVKLSSVF
jgi:hypothetical protein